MSVRETTKKKGKDYPVGPVLLGFFMFVVTGSFFKHSSMVLELNLEPEDALENHKHGNMPLLD
ncbi:membrane protein [Populus alba x Populus x berolinensis]|uniref:Membrane protein n=1 Tax=Populus alba x Populus x berolinensis TaxID=444605 RepID=A0AAD6R9B8_9ROSI|nr:membrane protein [Populus alba x Populus x berolinensis]